MRLFNHHIQTLADLLLLFLDLEEGSALAFGIEAASAYFVASDCNSYVRVASKSKESACIQG